MLDAAHDRDMEAASDHRELSETITTRAQALAFLTEDGGSAHLLVPCSRYGRDCRECAPVAWRAAVGYADATGEPITPDLLGYLMGLVVNDHEDIVRLVGLQCPECDSTNVRPPHGHHLASCYACGLAFEREECSEDWDED